METPATSLAGIAFPHLDLETATTALLSGPGRAAALPWRFINTYCVSLARLRSGFTDVLRSEGINLADGKPVAWVLGRLSARAGCPSRAEQVRGPTFFRLVLDRGRATGVRHYLLGGTPETLRALIENIERDFPGALIVGAESPPFRRLTEDECTAQDERIRATGADLVWVGLGTPRQDVEAARLARVLGRPALGVGAAFDFVAGTRREAPAWMQRLTLEWLFRLVSEPRRLWRRYTVGSFWFAVAAARSLLRPARAVARSVRAWAGAEDLPAWRRAGIPDRRAARADRRRASRDDAVVAVLEDRRRSGPPDRRGTDESLSRVGG